MQNNVTQASSWQTHTPNFDGDAPDGVTLETHEVEIKNWYGGWDRIHHNLEWYAKTGGLSSIYQFRPSYEIIQAKLDAALARVAELETDVRFMLNLFPCIIFSKDFLPAGQVLAMPLHDDDSVEVRLIHERINLEAANEVKGQEHE